MDWSKDSTKITVESILKKFSIWEKDKGNQITIVDFSFLKKELNREEYSLIKKVLQIKAEKYGIKLPYLGWSQLPDDLVPINGQEYVSEEGVKKTMETQYLRKRAYEAYQKLSHKILTDLKKRLLVGSAYRSWAYQCLLFLYYLKSGKFIFEKTIKRVAIPAYSEHCSSERMVVDFITEYGSPSDERPLDFALTEEYRWLENNASQFGFELSYSNGNKLGIMYEPWHWRMIENF